tara:strand:- start:258 stop:560 length:303 start_codon:yes stop_codon:yes gene_type:complete
MKIIYTFLLLIFLFLLNSCQTIENKTDKIGKKEIKELSQFLQQPESELKIVMGEPDKIIQNDKGTQSLIYTKKKYGITCERKFEIDKNKMVIAVSSRGCF